MDKEEKLRRQLARELEPYRALLIAFVSGEISADEFEVEYLQRYQDDPRWMPDAVFDIADAFFADVDAYVSDEAHRDLADGDLGPDELRERAAELLRRAGYDVPD